MSLLFKKKSLRIFAAIFVSIFLCLPVFASVCTYDVDGNGTIDPASEYWTCIGEAGQLCPYNIADCTEAAITMSGSSSIGATNIADKNGVTRIQAGAAAAKLDFYGWQCADNSCTAVYIGDIEFAGTGIEGTVSVQRITRLAGNNDKIEVYGCNGDGCTEESLQGSITVSGSTITGTVQSSEGFLSVEASGNDLIFTGIECSYGHCQEIPAGSLTIEGSTFSICPHGSRYTCYYNSNLDKYQCSTIECGDGTLGGSIGEGSKICAKDLNGDGTINFSSGTQEVYECRNVEGGLYCVIGAVACEQDTRKPICPEGATFNPATDKCEATPNISCPSGGYVYVSDVDTCIVDVSCPNGGSLNPDSDLCEIVVTSDLCPAGYTYNENLDLCTKEATCTGGGIYNSVTDRCELPPDYDCPAGYVYNPDSGMCEVTPECVNGAYNASTDRCEQGASTVCASGYTYNSSLGVCVTSATCPTGSNLNTFRDECEAAYGYDCPTGYTYNSSDGVCQKSPLCPGGGIYNTLRNQCEIDNTWNCLTGTLSGSICYVAATCTEGSLNTSRDKCEVAYTPACISGYTYNSTRDKCEAEPVCPGGSGYNATYNVCLKAVSSTTCPTGYTFNSSRQQCEKAPTCPSGSSYNTGTNRCEMSVQWHCSVNEGTYSSQSTCDSACVQTGTCTQSVAQGDEHWCWKNWTGCSGCLCDYPGSYGFHGGCTESEWGTTTEWCKAGDCMGLPYACWVPGSSDQCPGNNPPSGATVRGCWERKIPEEGGGCTARFYEFHSWHDQIVTYICSLTGTSYSSSSACQSNCSQSVACTSTCPSEYTKSGSLCIANASCSSGGTLNTSVGKCQYAPTYNCDSGYTYDSAIGYCKANATCNSSGTLNTSDDKCQLSYSYSCPSDYTYNYTYSVCQKTPVCSSGTYNTSTDRCEQDASAVCTTGYTYDGATGMCKVNVICGDGGSLNTSTDKCEITYTPTCASGFAYNAAYDVCQIVPSCPTGGSYNTSHDQCEVDNSWNCPSGMSLTGSTCYEAVTCPSGGNLNGDTELCEADSTFACFTSGYSYDGSANRCISDPVCDYGYYDVSIDLCRLSASGICPETYTYNSYQNKCLLDPPCLVGAAYSTTLNQCSISAVYDCPDTSEYSAVTRLCWAYPMCPGDMPYNEEINGCDGGYRTCPLGAYPCLPEPGTGIKKCSPNECFDPIAAIVGTDEEADTTSYHNDGDRDPETGECEGIVYIFNGKGGTCKTPGMQTMFFNCCDTSEGSFLMVKKTCGEAEAMTMQAVQAGRCHYVGDYCAKKWKFIGCVQRAKTYCCFNSKLGRIIQEQGREQLQNFQPGGNWGSAESPNCVGFTPEQFAMIDFSRIDLSEFVGDIQGQIKTNIEEGMENKIDDFYDNY